MSHTSGPWHRNIRASGKYATVFAGRNKHVAVVQQQTDSDETEANIDLISAAPTMLAALQAVTALPGFEANEPYGVQVLAAIANATGAVEVQS